MQVEYLLKKICMAMSIEFNCVELDDFFSQDSGHQNGITVWVFLEMMNSGKVTRGIDKSIISMAIEEVYREIVGDVLKEVGGQKSTPIILHFTSVTAYGCIALDSGLSVEKRTAEEKLEGALVHFEAQQPVVLHRRGPQGLSREYSPGWELLCGGKQ